jgi:hypothetical protein
MTDQNGWPDASKPGYPISPGRKGAHVLDVEPDRTGKRRRIAALWAHGRWLLGADYYVLARDAANWGWQYVGPCYTPAEVAALVEAARREGEGGAFAAGARSMRTTIEIAISQAARNEEVAIAERIRARGGAIPGEYRSEAEQERVELFNRLGRVTEELRLPMGATAIWIIEAIRERVDGEREAARREEREACASVSVRVEVPAGAETWSPLEAWEEALTVLDGAFRDAIRARGDA